MDEEFFQRNGVKLLAAVLTRLVQLNDKIVDANAISTRFHSVTVPEISIEKYLQRIIKYTDCGLETLVCSVMYVMRFSRKSSILVTSLNVHRLLITSVTIAIKYIEDGCFTNRYMGKIGGVSLHELNKMEMSFLKHLEFKLGIVPEVFDQFCLEVCHLELLSLKIDNEKTAEAVPRVDRPAAPVKAKIVVPNKKVIRVSSLTEGLCQQDSPLVC
mmetsp:Transcript_1676/g.2270  ORF Transcript_1676/g.2270 Transcript_1676/m.2270 type:complete len:214 (-) Transcript_1676:82-723(-)|eukprot:CAMPEP_0201478102 /NCGR_PEP_ID=MMETSP0151_2-20130828/3016_1 /ASSEMBLY_ACC=CAM_ASM_000257 /TAXON_ID=200890 /ORGANISM="Paramoeba atlantica, Strain 621/1 / CCAP 1560/9" /LENGTH=213 /DNA_ID=CAMNT_0047859073 /DNA_START=218 /DNA_END=859 /DNA_ORIENTATION=-